MVSVRVFAATDTVGGLRRHMRTIGERAIAELAKSGFRPSPAAAELVDAGLWSGLGPAFGEFKEPEAQADWLQREIEAVNAIEATSWGLAEIQGKPAETPIAELGAASLGRLIRALTTAFFAAGALDINLVLKRANAARRKDADLWRIPLASYAEPVLRADWRLTNSEVVRRYREAPGAHARPPKSDLPMRFLAAKRKEWGLLASPGRRRVT